MSDWGPFVDPVFKFLFNLYLIVPKLVPSGFSSISLHFLSSI